MDIDNKESVRHAIINFLESFYHFFGRRFSGGLIDDIINNTGIVRKMFLERPIFMESVTINIGSIKYNIQIFGRETVDDCQFAPTIRISKLTEKYWKPTIDSLLNIAYTSDTNAEIEFINNSPIIIKDIYTRNQLRKWFGWTENELNLFYRFLDQYLVKVL